MTKLGALLCSALLLLLATACSEAKPGRSHDATPGTGGPTETASPGSSARAEPSEDQAVACSLDTATDARPAAENDDLGPPVVARTSADDGSALVVRGVLSAGRLLASASTGDSGDQLGTPRLGVLSPSGFAALRYDPSPSRGHQITAAEAQGSTTTWVETTSMDLFNFDWKIYAADLERPGRRLLADSDTVYGTRPLSPVYGQTIPTVAGDSVYWAATPPGADRSDGVIWRAGLDDASIEAVSRGVMPSGAGRSLYFVRRTGDGAQIVRRDTAKGAEWVVSTVDSADGEVTRLAASTRLVAWVVARPQGDAALYIHQRQAGELCRIALHQRGPETMVMSAAGHFLAWGNGSVDGDAGEYLLDMRSRGLWRLGEASGYSVGYVGPGAVAWARLPEDAAQPQAAQFLVASW
ncbi:hypothetical protein ACJ5H2_05375 [Nocardioides sp. R1-1]|uniref:hypothetical protein n=1 Tax=Nocardioides sp. R1-1 TaxID=3383502 RepID=UPI0038D0C2A9